MSHVIQDLESWTPMQHPDTGEPVYRTGKMLTADEGVGAVGALVTTDPSAPWFKEAGIRGGKSTPRFIDPPRFETWVRSGCIEEDPVPQAHTEEAENSAQDAAEATQGTATDPDDVADEEEDGGATAAVGAAEEGSEDA